MQMIEYLRGIGNINPWLAASSTGKIAFKFGNKHLVINFCKFFTIHLSKEGTKASGKALGKSIAKYVPVVSVVIGCASAIFRFINGQPKMAVGELISGFSAMIPGCGTAASIAIDIGLGINDIHEAISARTVKIVPTIEMNENLCYRILQIDITEHPSPSKEIVNRHFNDQVLLLHPDKNPMFEELGKKTVDQLTNLVNDAKKHIYKQKRWS